jgi:uncharacterized protein (TIGR02145 family)
MGRQAHREPLRAPSRVSGAFRRRAALVIVVAAALGAGSTAAASKPVPPLRMEQLATAWVGGTVGGGTSDKRARVRELEVPVAAPWKAMADGKQWTVENLNVDTAPSYCYDDAELNCSRFGRLYTWESAQRACRSLGDRWRLPTENEWSQLATHHGGVSEDAKDRVRAAYAALVTGGRAGFGAVLGGGRSAAGAYERIEAHGFYWTASESGPATAWFYNFGKGGQALHRQREGDKPEAFSVRCVRE